MNQRLKLDLLLGLFVTLLIGMNMLGVKVISLFGVAVSAGIFMVPFTFLITDIVEEVYGKKVAKHFIIVGVVALVVIFCYTAFCVKLGAHQRYLFNEEYKIIFGSSLRIIFASLIAFLMAQFWDVFVFDFLKRKTHSKALWLRNNLSTMTSQAIDTFIFMMIAFYQIAPKFDFIFIMKMAIPYYIFKIVFALLDTPLVYLGVYWLKEKEPAKESEL